MGLLAENGKISPEYFLLIISHFLQTRPRPAMAQPSDPGSGPGPLRSEREEAEAEPVGLQARRSSLSTGTAGVCCGSGRKNLNDFKQLKQTYPQPPIVVFPTCQKFYLLSILMNISWVIGIQDVFLMEDNIEATGADKKFE